jgi:transcription antitermination factor NusG
MLQHIEVKLGETVAPFNPGLVACSSQVHWYAIYTCPNRERKIAAQLANRGFEHFLPQYESVRRWKDRRVRLQMPLFPGYVFVHLALQNRVGVLQIPGVVRFVGFDGRAIPVLEEDLTRVREFFKQGLRAEPHPFLTVGRRVRVGRGPLTGMQGILVRRKNKLRFVVSVELIMRSVSVEIDETDLQPI